MRSRRSLALTKLHRCTLSFSPARDLVAQPEQTLRTFDGHLSYTHVGVRGCHAIDPLRMYPAISAKRSKRRNGRTVRAKSSRPHIVETVETCQRNMYYGSRPAYMQPAHATCPTHPHQERNHQGDPAPTQNGPSTKPNTAKRQAANHPGGTPTTRAAGPQPAAYDAPPCRPQPFNPRRI